MSGGKLKASGGKLKASGRELKASGRKLKALVREVSPSIARCELTHLSRTSIDLPRARSQHQAYVQALRDLGCDVLQLPAEPDLPDSVFVEDGAVVVDEVAVLTRPGAETRRAEVDSLARALQPFRELVFLREPALLDGGDVLRLGRDVYVGLTSRSTAAGIDQLGAALRPHGYRVHPVEVQGCLHLKTAVTQVDDGRVLLNPDWISPIHFTGMEAVEVDPKEPMAANALRVQDTLVYSDSHVRTAERLRAAGVNLRTVPADELGKAEGGVTCSSLLFWVGP
jgi:dimethylargininase